ncbi:hypothetical protein LCL95_06975 [Bacillus timonensis]|nr:hypothetical protein [Bacillus timonensis]
MKNFFERAYEIAEPMLPKHFDENEWFTIFISIGTLSISIYLLKTSTALLHTEVIGILLFNLLYTTVGDYFLAMPPYDFYDTVDRNSGELMDIFLQNVVYPFTLLNFIYAYKIKKINKFLFFTLAVTALTLLEWISVEFFHLYTFKTWTTWYSSLFYAGVVIANIIFYHTFHRYVQRLRSKVQKNFD